MSDLGETFFTSIGCMDGRVQDPVAEFGRKKFGVKFADTITEAGLVGLLSNKPSQALLDSLRQKVLISIEKHHSKGIIVHGHQKCAGNPVDDKKHREDVLSSVEILKSFTPEDFEIVPVFVTEENGKWIAASIVRLFS